MVLGHQSVLANMSGGPPGLQPALQLAAVAAAHLAPRSRVPWAPFLQFGMTNPMLFGAPFLARPHFNGHTSHNLLNTPTNSQSPGIISNRSAQSQQSGEDSNDERGEFSVGKLFFQLFSMHFTRASLQLLWRKKIFAKIMWKNY
jgi:hypothetical protein